jgi:lipoprotein-anchoring transpeptidase ErfK/SrfK
MKIQPHISRREFLKVCGAAFLGTVNQPLMGVVPDGDENPVGIGRVTTEIIYIYNQPTFDGQRIDHYKRDRLISLKEQLISPYGPIYNPIWYRVEKGYVHSGYLQRVDDWHFSAPLSGLPDGNLLGEITVPYVRAFRRNSAGTWVRLYRLYYQSTHWITGIEAGPMGTPIYRLLDDWLKVYYFVPASALTALTPEMYSPLASNGLQRDDRRIVIDLGQQKLTAYENDRIVLQTIVSTGKPRAGDQKEKPTTTPLGSFRIRNKFPSRHMGYGALTDNIFAYELPGVPWTMIFHKDGYALHGAYWHNNFGTRMSHGCVNMRYDDAKWLFRWTAPEFGTGIDYHPGQMYTMGEGTIVQIIEGG